jgi:hypothetical protein
MSAASAASARSPSSRYAIGAELGVGGMAAVHLGMLRGAGSFARLVAIKRLHPHLRGERELCDMLIDEAQLASKVRHPNVVPVLDTFAEDGDLHLVMEYVHGLALSQLMPLKKKGDRAPAAIAVGLLDDALAGLHAVHLAKDDHGGALGIVHRDVSPHNFLLGADGVVRVTDFGIARAAHRLSTTRHTERKGKAGYMAPEQIDGRPVDPRADVFAAAVVLWELLTGRRLFRGESEAEIFEQLRAGVVVPPGSLAAELPAALDDVLLSALAHDPGARPESAQAFAAALRAIVPRASAQEILAWAAPRWEQPLAARAVMIAELSARAQAQPAATSLVPSTPPPPLAHTTDDALTPRPGLAPTRRAGLSLGIGLALVAPLAVAATVAVVRRADHATNGDARAALAGVTSQAASPTAAADPQPSIAASAGPSAAAGDEVLDLGGPDAPDSSPADGRPTKGPPRGPRRRTSGVGAASAQPSAGVAKGPDCDPPYVLDGLGRKIYRRECL